MMPPNLREYDVILVNSSGGKDSQAMLEVVNHQALAVGVRDRIVVVHCDLGRVEWRGTRALAKEQAGHYGNRFEVVSRRQGDLLDHVEQRGMWPSPAARYCTSDHKRSQASRVMTQLVAEAAITGRRARILNCMGLRAEESDARAKRQPLLIDDPVYSNKTKRQVDTWLPIFHWTEADVWSSIRASGVRHHFAYDLGMPRLSCCFCIFAPKAALMLAGAHNPELLNEYVRVEHAINHTFKPALALVEIQRALAAGEQAAGTIEWAQCA